MKQVLQNLKNGETEVADIPVPASRRGHILIRTRSTLVSAGTERMLVDFGKAGLISKARQQPDKVRMVLDKVRTDGIGPTLEAVRNKLDQPLAMGYCNVGEVIEVGAGVTGFKIGDRVASAGKHAEIVSVPVNLCARIPDGVEDEQAVFTVLSSIALQGLRLAQPTLGETVVVTGLGLIGLLTVQLLRANGCRVIGLDLDAGKLEMARAYGAETVDLSTGADPVAAANAFTQGRGVDAVIITASTKSNEPMRQAAAMCRKRGRIVLVGVTGLELSRADFYEKELTFQVSCSYGPGRHDPSYEERGVDYPIGFVRWTEQRNFEAVLHTMRAGALDTKKLVSHRFTIDDAASAYALVSGGEPSLGVVLDYPKDAEGITDADHGRTIKLASRAAGGTGKEPRIAFIGAGNYAGAVLIPAFKSTGATLHTVASANGVSGLHAARKFGFAETTTDTQAILSDPDVDAVVVSTRHDSHAELVLGALDAAKHVFVEKPLCLTVEELNRIAARIATFDVPPMLMVGFNRRFAPQIVRIAQLLDSTTGPKSFVMTVNAGQIPASHWTQDKDVGGGRIIGEACHFIDLLRFLARSPITRHGKLTQKSATGDTASISLAFEDGSIGTIHYFANGNKAFPKERLEVFSEGRVLQLDNFRTLSGFGWQGFRKMNLWKQDKGQSACAAAFVEAIQNGASAPIPLDEILEIARVTIEVAEADG